MHPWIARRFCPMDLELFTMIVICAGILVFGLGNNAFLATILGRDPHVAFRGDATVETLLLLLILNLVSVACGAVMPIRSHLSWILPCVGIGTCGLVLLTTSLWSHAFPIVI